jgi:phosphohistidine phosphatase
MSTRQLVLVRHSKAAHGTVDIERALTDRGRRDAAALGAWLAKAGLRPDRAVVSPARRAAETWRCAGQAATVTEDRIYDNSVDDLLAVIGETPSDVQLLAIVGHNPSIGTLAAILDDGHGDVTARSELHQGYPTTAVAVFTLPGLFSELAAHSATLTHYAAPRG